MVRFFLLRLQLSETSLISLFSDGICMSDGCAEIVSSFLPLHLVYALKTIVILLEQIFKNSQAWILFLT
jgi:hypothetical protein